MLQTDIRWLDAAGNLSRCGELLEEAFTGEGKSPDLVVLPEMFATGFCMEPDKCAPFAESITQWMTAAASLYDTALAGTVAVETPEGYRNRLYFVRPDGNVAYYDKRHLFGYAGEDKIYGCGKRRVIVRWRGFDILLQTCYDLRFPVFSRNRDDYQLAVYCASWPASRIAVWDTLLRARAIENASYVIGVNRVGSDPTGAYPGHSAVINFRGETAAKADGETEGHIFHTLSLEELYRFREKFPVLNDGDRFVME